MVLKAIKKQATSCSGVQNPLISFVDSQVYDQLCMNKNVDKCHVKTEKLYRTRFVNNSKLKQPNIESLIAVPKGKALELYDKCGRLSINTKTSNKVLPKMAVTSCGPMVEKSAIFVRCSVFSLL